MDTESGREEARIRLNQRHLLEWNKQLDLEARTRITLDKKHKQEYLLSQTEEVNFLERVALASRQLQEIRALGQQNRRIRIAIRKRQAQEKADLAGGL